MVKVHRHARAIPDAATNRDAIQKDLDVYASVSLARNQALDEVLGYSRAAMTPSRPYFFILTASDRISVGVSESHLMGMGYKKTISAEDAVAELKEWNENLMLADSHAWMAYRMDCILLFLDMKVKDVEWSRAASTWTRWQEWGFRPTKEPRPGDIVVYHASSEATVTVGEHKLAWASEWPLSAVCIKAAADGKPAVVEAKLGSMSAVYEFDIDSPPPDAGTHWVAMRTPKVIERPARLRLVKEV